MIAVDLHPSSMGFLNSVAIGVQGNQQVGYGQFPFSPNIQHALLWTGAAQSVVDLHPSLEEDVASYSRGVVDFWELGVSHAHLWNGTAASAVNLHLLLPSGFNSSIAYTLDSQGVIYGLAKTDDFQWHSVMWTTVPEPQSVVPAATALIGSACVLHRRFTRMFGCHQ